MWPAGISRSQLLFIFPTKVNLTTITLHYYSDSEQGLPRLRFYVVPDDFAIWDALFVSYNSAEVAAQSPGGEPAGLSSVSLINLRFHTRKMLMYKISSSYVFALSEVEFFTCSCKP